MPRCYATRFIQHALREKCSWARPACVFGYAAAGRVVMEGGSITRAGFRLHLRRSIALSP